MTNDPENKGEAEDDAAKAARLADRGKRVLSDAEQRRRERAAAAVARVVDLRAQPTAGAPDRVVAGLGKRITVIRRVPLCWRLVAGWSRAGGHG